MRRLVRKDVVWSHVFNANFSFVFLAIWWNACRQEIPSQNESGQLSCSSQHVVYLDITNRKATGIEKREKQRYDVNGEGYKGLVLDNGSKKALINDVRISEAPRIASFWHIIWVWKT